MIMNVIINKEIWPYFFINVKVEQLKNIIKNLQITLIKKLRILQHLK